jgi:hypothetical protein
MLEVAEVTFIGNLGIIAIFSSILLIKLALVFVRVVKVHEKLNILSSATP